MTDTDTAKQVEAACTNTATALGILITAMTKKSIRRSQLAMAKELLEQAARALG